MNKLFALAFVAAFGVGLVACGGQKVEEVSSVEELDAYSVEVDTVTAVEGESSPETKSGPEEVSPVR
jgi:hypothetical protein